MDYENRFTVEKHIVRWKTNNSVPPVDCLDEMVEQGLITPRAKVLSVIVRDFEVAQSIARYRKQMENHVPSGEELFEMRAAFGEGEEVVNVITGKKIQL